MKGEKHIYIRHKNRKYYISVDRNISIIKGESATGKSTIVNYLLERDNPFVKRQSNCNVEVIPRGYTKPGIISNIKDSVIILDEQEAKTYNQEIANSLEGDSNYYILITRYTYNNIPYSYKSIYEMKEVRKGIFKNVPKYTLKDDIYTTGNMISSTKNNFCEDSKSGYKILKEIIPNMITMKGNSSYVHYIENLNDILLIMDGSAIGSQIENIIELLARRNNSVLYIPECIEELICKTENIDTNYNEVEYSKYKTIERYLYDLVRDNTKGQENEYTKNLYNKYYFKEDFLVRFKNILPRIIQEIIEDSTTSSIDNWWK